MSIDSMPNTTEATPEELNSQLTTLNDELSQLYNDLARIKKDAQNTHPEDTIGRAELKVYQEIAETDIEKKKQEIEKPLVKLIKSVIDEPDERLTQLPSQLKLPEFETRLIDAIKGALGSPESRQHYIDHHRSGHLMRLEKLNAALERSNLPKTKA